MVQVKIYECPTCQRNFTSKQIKANDYKCPSCDIALKHELDKSAGKMVHRWVIDENAVLAAEPPKEAGETKFEMISKRGDVPEIYRRVKPLRKEGDALYRVLYKNRYGSTHLRCPSCDKYLHTTNMISGSKQEALCRSPSLVDGSWVKCKIRTEFWFFQEGEEFNARND